MIVRILGILLFCGLRIGWAQCYVVSVSGGLTFSAGGDSGVPYWEVLFYNNTPVSCAYSIGGGFVSGGSGGLAPLGATIVRANVTAAFNPSPYPRSGTITILTTPTGGEASAFNFPVTQLGSFLPTYAQGDEPWGSKLYDDSAEDFADKGCAVTSLAMALSGAGLLIDPQKLNEFMVGKHDFNDDHDVRWDTTVADLRQDLTYNPGKKPVMWRGVDATNTTQLSAALTLNNGAPIIVKVPPISNCNVLGSIPGGHFVLVTGQTQTPNGPVFSINDPGCKSHTSLDSYPAFQARGYVSDPVDLSALYAVVGDNAEAWITNAAGQKTGFISSTQDVHDIANSYYYKDFLTSVTTGADATGTAHLLGINTPAPGTYTIVLVGTKAGPYTLDIRPYSQDGSRQPPIVLNGRVAAGTSLTYRILFAAQPGGISTANQVIGDVNGDGSVNCGDATIVAMAFGKRTGQAGFDPRADLNLDGVVDIRDLSVVSQHLPAGTRCQ